MKLGPFKITKRRFDQLSGHTVYIISVDVPRGRRTVEIELGRQLSNPSFDQCVDYARAERAAHKISTTTYQKLFADAVAAGYRSPEACVSLRSARVPYWGYLSTAYDRHAPHLAAKPDIQFRTSEWPAFHRR